MTYVVFARRFTVVFLTIDQVHMTLTGEVVLDVAQHFVERWNEVKKRKVIVSESCL